MGCGSSSGADPCPDEEELDWKNMSEDSEFEAEEANTRVYYDRTTGGVEKKHKERPEEYEFFDGVDAGSGEQFMSVRPYAAYIIDPPTNHPEANADAPEEKYVLDYVYGYRCEDSRQNVFYNPDGQVVYMTAAVGVILDTGANSQKFFGGGQTDNTSKQTASDKEMHTDDITSLSYSKDRTLAVTGQNGQRPVAFVWDTATGEKKHRFKLPKGGRSIKACALSVDSTLVALVANDNDHTVSVFEVESGDLVYREKGGPDPVYDCFWSQKDDHYEFVTAGRKHFKWWWPKDSKVKKGLYMGNGKPTSHSCCTWDDNETAYTGGANGSIYVWKGRELTKTYKPQEGRGFICSIIYVDGKIISGGRTKQIFISDPESEAVERTISVDHLIRALDMSGGKILAGLINGSIVEIDDSDSATTVMQGHSQGEAWGLAPIGDDKFVTSGDDNKVMVWSLDEKKCISEGGVCEENRKPKRGKASTLSNLSASKCARAVAYCDGNGHIAVGHNDGTVSIRESADSVGATIKELNESEEWIEAMAYSPCGEYLAVGSHDNKVYVHKVNDDYSLLGYGKAHSSFIVSVDWSADSTFLRTICGAHELIWFTVNGEGVEQDTSGYQNTMETEWATSSAKYGWLVTGIFPSGTDGTHINHVDFSKDQSLIVTGDDYGLVNVWRNPAREGHHPISLRGHSEHVVRTRFMKDTEYIITIGGYDKTIFQWKKE